MGFPWDVPRETHAIPRSDEKSTTLRSDQNSGHCVLLQRLREAHALRSDQFVHGLLLLGFHPTLWYIWTDKGGGDFKSNLGVIKLCK
jgi:hypothetical protein